MKKIFSLFLFVLISAFVLAQTTYTTAQTGSWNANSTWVGGSPPQLLGDNIVIIDQNHEVTLAGYFASGSITVNSNAKLIHSTQPIVEFGGSLTIVIDGTYQREDEAAAAPYPGMTVNGTYIHNYNGGSISENINWGTNATLVLSGFSDPLPGTNGVGADNLIINSTDISTNFDFPFAWDTQWQTITFANTNGYEFRFTESSQETHEITADIVIEPNSQLRIPPQGRVEITGSLTNNAGSTGLLLDSGPPGTASLIYDGTGIEATVKQVFSADRWYLVSIPFGDTETYDYRNGTNDAFMRPYLSPGDGWGPYYGQPSVVLNVGEGYELWQTASFTFEESGTLLSGNYNLPIAAGGSVDPDWNFLGNPYPCGIDWAQVSDKTNVVGSAFYVYNGSSYVNHNGTSGTATSSVIPPMQGFFVQHSSGTEIGINNSHKAHAGKPIYKKSMNQVTYSNHFKIKAASATAESVCVIYQQEEATNGTDDLYDAPILFNNDPNFMEVFSLAGERRSCINIYNDYPYDVFLGFRVPEGGAEFTLEAFDFRFIDATFTIILEDMLTGTMLTLDENTSYTFSTEEAGMLEDRIVLHLNSTVGIDENETTHFNVYAIRNQIFVEGTYNQTYEISVYNVLGQAVYFDSRLQNNQIIELSVPAGTYIVKLRSEYGMQTEKINIAH
jgi:hypothetical protein